MKITICGCASRSFISKEQVAQLAAAAHKAGMDVEVVEDLCELCETKDERVQQLAEGTIVACHERAVRSLLSFACAKGRDCLDLRGQGVEHIMTKLSLEAASAEEVNTWKEKVAQFPKKLGEDAWYPTLDKDACAECGKCLEFCPFGVYEMVNDRIAVVHPQSCKNNCPACARQCPANAIIFPKYDRSPINGGVEMQERAVKLNTRELFGEALRQKLADRKAGIKLMK